MQFIMGSSENLQHQMSMENLVVVCDATDAAIEVLLPSVSVAAGCSVIVRKQFGANVVTVVSDDAMEWTDVVVGDTSVILMSDGVRWVPLVDLGTLPV